MTDTKCTVSDYYAISQLHVMIMIILGVSDSGTDSGRRASNSREADGKAGDFRE